MKTIIIYGALAAVVALFFMYLDTRILDNPKTRSTYIKNMLLVGSIVGYGIYLVGEEGFEKLVGITVSHNNLGAGSDSYLHGIDEPIMTGSPNF